MTPADDTVMDLASRLTELRAERDARRRARLRASKLDAHRGEIARLMREQQISAPELVALMRSIGVRISTATARRFLRTLAQEVNA